MSNIRENESKSHTVTSISQNIFVDYISKAFIDYHSDTEPSLT
jgi:hypothetical protein